MTRATGKPAPHAVKPEPELGHYKVTSGRSGTIYVVTPLGGDAAACTCEYMRHAKGDRVCSHIQAVRAHAVKILAGTVEDPFARIKE